MASTNVIERLSTMFEVLKICISYSRVSLGFEGAVDYSPRSSQIRCFFMAPPTDWLCKEATNEFQESNDELPVDPKFHFTHTKPAEIIRNLKRVKTGHKFILLGTALTQRRCAYDPSIAIPVYDGN